MTYRIILLISSLVLAGCSPAQHQGHQDQQIQASSQTAVRAEAALMAGIVTGKDVVEDKQDDSIRAQLGDPTEIVERAVGAHPATNERIDPASEAAVLSGILR